MKSALFLIAVLLLAQCAGDGGPIDRLFPATATTAQTNGVLP